MKRKPRTPEQDAADLAKANARLIQTWAEGDAEDKAMIRNIVPWLFDEEGQPLKVKAKE